MLRRQKTSWVWKSQIRLREFKNLLVNMAFRHFFISGGNMYSVGPLNPTQKTAFKCPFLQQSKNKCWSSIFTNNCITRSHHCDVFSSFNKHLMYCPLSHQAIKTAYLVIPPPRISLIRPQWRRTVIMVLKARSIFKLVYDLTSASTMKKYPAKEDRTKKKWNYCWFIAVDKVHKLAEQVNHWLP